jgi:zinc transport system substrate-binding protein
MRAALVLLTLTLILPLPARGGSGARVEVVASIAPVHSLAARVMQGAGAPRLLLPPGTSPHDYALRPSDAAALRDAALVVWTGPRLEPWLERPLASLAGHARVLRLDRVPGLTLLPVREGAAFEAHDDGDHGGESAHAEDETDPHLWLDPENAKLWLDALAGALSAADPANRALYLANAAAARAEIGEVRAEVEALLAPLRGRPFIVFHDAFHYFEHRFAIEAAGAVSLSDARAPGPARIAEIRDRIRALGAVCLFAEPQLRTALIATVAEGTGARIGMLDPLGAGLQPGPDLYPALLRNLAGGLADCLG